MPQPVIARSMVLLAVLLASEGARSQAAPWSTTVAGSPGSGGGVPTLVGVGPLTPQSSNVLQLTGALPLRPAVLVFGLAEIDAPFKGGTLGPAPQLLVVLATDAAGTLAPPFVLPDSPAGVTGYLQAWIEDDGAAHGWASSNGLQFVTQPGPASATLHYVGRFKKSPAITDHLMGVEVVLGHDALVSSFLGLKLIDLDALPVQGTTSTLDVLPGLDCFTSYTSAAGYVYVNLRQGGFAVVRLDAQAHTLTLLKHVAEPGVFFNKMFLSGNRLYVAAHAYGLRIYSLANPASPQLVGSLATGFSDAFAVAVQGTQAWVADGDGGLKVVDISSEAAPVITYADDPQATLGAAEDVRIIGAHVYVAHGSSGVAVHSLADPAVRTLYDTPRCAKHLGQAGPWLGVADIGGLEVFRIQPDGSLLHAARESGLYRQDPAGQFGLSLRLWHGVAGWGETRFVTADWDTVDVYEVVDPLLDAQPDILASSQRLRFAPTGGSALVTLTNAGAGVLDISDISTSVPTIGLGASSATLAPGATLQLEVSYAGGQPGGGLILCQSNDPDEGVLPIQVFGETAYIDPGEPAIPFVLPQWTYDHAAKSFLYDTFDLEHVDGQVLYFQSFGTW